MKYLVAALLSIAIIVCIQVLGDAIDYDSSITAGWFGAVTYYSCMNFFNRIKLNNKGVK